MCSLKNPIETVVEDLALDLDEPLTFREPAGGVPPLIDHGDAQAPAAPQTLAETGIDPQRLIDLATKLANTVPSFSSDWACEQLCLPLSLVDEIYWKLKDDQLIEILGQSGPLSYRYSLSNRGREYARHLLEINGYVGPAPVAAASYAAFLEAQVAGRPRPEAEDVRRALSDLVLTETVLDVAALAATSGRSLFLFGPPGNGKTSLGRALHKVNEGTLWIPHCIAVGSDVVRIYDPQCHHPVEGGDAHTSEFDRRWIEIHRPFVVSGGEMTIEALDLAYSEALRFYEAPLHVKANGGTFMIDDFGRQHVNPEELLNRWIIPLEHNVDHLTLKTGQLVQVPFRLMLIVATNLALEKVGDPAFLRRMGYRLHLEAPSVDDYTEIFRHYAQSVNVDVPDGLLEGLLERYRREHRELRSSEPRDLIERSRDICRLRNVDEQLSPEILDLAWAGYFGVDKDGAQQAP